jgi:hypothetical protein
MPCPNCGSELQQLGTVTPAPLPVWFGENLYRCPDCRPGRFTQGLIGPEPFEGGTDAELHSALPAG